MHDEPTSRSGTAHGCWAWVGCLLAAALLAGCQLRHATERVSPRPGASIGNLELQTPEAARAPFDETPITATETVGAAAND